ncbi:MAG TPA: site-specific tyrosine recombinase XerD [Actinopolymorphaceae bacterium]
MALERAVGAYLDHLAVERGLAANTVASYRRDLLRYADFLQAHGVREPGQVRESDVASFLMALREGDEDHPPLAAGSAARTVVAVRGFHRFAHRDGMTSDDPARAVRPPAPPRRLPKALAVDEVERILEVAGMGDTPLALRDKALLEFLYGTGARISEAVGLDIDDLHLDVGGDGGEVLLRGKGGKQRVVPVGAYATAAIEAYRVRARPVLSARRRGPSEGGARKNGSGAKSSTAALFLNARGGRLSRQSAWTVLRTAAARAGVTAEVSPHTLRHSFATHLLDGGADVRVVQELLGHASVTTTQVYTLVTVDKLREVYAAAHPRAQG